MNKTITAAGLVLLIALNSVSCAKGKVYTKGDLKMSIVRVEWNKIFAGPYELQGGGLIISLNIYSNDQGTMPNLPLFVRTASGELIKQGTTSSRQKGRKTLVETFFLIQKTDEKLSLIVGAFDPIPISPMDRL